MIKRYIINKVFIGLDRLYYFIVGIDNKILDMEDDKIDCNTPKIILWVVDKITPFYWLSSFIFCLSDFIEDHNADMIDYETLFGP